MSDYIPLEPINTKPFIEAAISLIEHDECLRALKLLDNLPAYYRDYPPKEIVQLKKLIRSKVFTVQDYAENQHDAMRSEDWGKQCIEGTYRGQILHQIVKAYNDKNVHPHVVDYGPGEWAFPLGLKKLGCQFSYRDIGLSKFQHQARDYLKDYYTTKDRGPAVFIATEIIEHLKDVNEIRQEFDRIDADVDYIVTSTPTYSFMIQKKWEKEGIGHLQAFTPAEFQQTITKMFHDQGFNWVYYQDQCMTMIGSRFPIEVTKKEI